MGRLVVCSGARECKIKECYNYNPRTKGKGLKVCRGRILVPVKPKKQATKKAYYKLAIETIREAIDNLKFNKELAVNVPCVTEKEDYTIYPKTRPIRKRRETNTRGAEKRRERGL